MSDHLRIYDITIDDLRAPTQADLNRFQATTQAFGMLRRGLAALLEVTLEVAQDKRPAFDVEMAIRGIK